MARKAKGSAGEQGFPVENFTNFSFKPGLTPFFRLLIFIEFIFCGFCVLGAGLLAILTYLADIKTQ